VASPFSVFKIDLGLTGLDAVACLERLLPQNGRGFIIEKNEDGRRRAWVGVKPFELLSVQHGRAISETARGRRVLLGNAFAALGKRIASFRTKGAEAFDGGAVGLLGYEMVRHLERVPVKPEPYEAVLMLFDQVLVVENGRASLRALVRSGKDRARAKERACEWASLLDGAGPVATRKPTKLLPVRGGRGKAAFLRGVAKIKNHIRAGDIFQAVLSEDFSARLKGGPLAAYRAIRAANASPYLFCLMGGDDAVMGASPERLVRVLGGVVRNCPIAGTRPRGTTRARDLKLEKELRASEKERAEHLMLVDLARNDLGRVCAPGSVAVERFMFTRRFTNVMHLVSEVEGRLDAGRTAWDALEASFPAGTVSGAPKVRAMEIIAEIERASRGFYAGSVIQHDFAGNLDSCLAIRSLSLSKGGKARLQAGAGIVADSSPAFEHREVEHKLKGLRRALGGLAA
jgi:anthranilate synthase component 1